MPVDGSENSLRALDFALDLAKRYGSKITVAHILPINVPKKVGEEVLRKAKERIRTSGLHVTFKLIDVKSDESSIPKAILDEAINGSYDMIVMGARGKTVSEDLNLGSVALAVVVNAPLTIIIVR